MSSKFSILRASHHTPHPKRIESISNLNELMWIAVGGGGKSGRISIYGISNVLLTL